MQVGIKDGGDGVPCWNRQAVQAYVQRVNAREHEIAERNPDVVLLPGRLVCYGCEVMELDYGVKCTASLTRTRYAVESETEPRTEDAVGSLLEVEGLRSRAPAELQDQVLSREKATTPLGASGSSAGPAAQPRTAPPHPGTPEPRRGGLRGLFGR